MKWDTLTDTHRLLKGIYEVRRSNEIRFHDKSTTFHKDFLRYSEIRRSKVKTQAVEAYRVVRC
jgi:hypothetical protein